MSTSPLRPTLENLPAEGATNDESISLNRHDDEKKNEPEVELAGAAQPEAKPQEPTSAPGGPSEVGPGVEDDRRRDSEDEVDGLVGQGGDSPEISAEQPVAVQDPEGGRREEEGNQQEQPDVSELGALENAEEKDAPGPSGDDHTDSAPGTAIASAIHRIPTPSSRTSTPPLIAGSAGSAPKKFSSVNVNKKFLSKTATPVTGSPSAGAAKLSLNGRATASPVPISSTTSRLLSTKLTTVPPKTSTSPVPPAGSASGSTSSSPWAKPALPPAEASASQPVVKRLTNAAAAIAMGSGQGIGVGQKMAWRPVNSESKGRIGMARDFPTATEVAEGKKAAQHAAQQAAQAQAAHNQQILQQLNTFTQLDPNAHRWDDEDDEDDIIDFGDGTVYTHEHLHHDQQATQPEASSVLDEPVAKSERFVEDFDRSWPRKQPVPVEPLRTESGRVLFNASSNRLEPTLPRQPPLSQNTAPRIISRPADPAKAPLMGRAFDRPLPPHIQAETDNGRMLPPHMINQPSQLPPPDSRPPGQNFRQDAPSRQTWGTQRELDRPPPPHLADRPPPPIDHARSPSHALPATLPPRRSFSHANVPPIPATPSSHAPSISPAKSISNLPDGPVDAQSAEMHTAAEKARLRRLAEEKEREEAAERARRKAKELEERLGLKAAITPSTGKQESNAAVVPGPPGLTKGAPAIATPSITIVQRPHVASKQPETEGASGMAGLPARPAEVPAEHSWRAKMEDRSVSLPGAVVASSSRSTRPTAESYFGGPAEATSTAVKDEVDELEKAVSAMVLDDKPKRESNFDSMLARIQAAMAQARATPPETGPSAPDPVAGKSEPDIADPPEPRVSLPPAPTTRPSSPPKPSVSLPASSPHIEFFDVTQPPPPRSPPPVWRTFNVKLPKPSTSGPKPIAQWRLKAFEIPLQYPPGWVMSFTPPIESLNPKTLSRADLCLPQPILRRFQKDMTPVVSISPRKLEPFKKAKKKPSPPVQGKKAEVEVPSAAVESLDSGSVPGISHSETLRGQRMATGDPRWSADAPVTPASHVSTAPAVHQEPLPERRKSRSPVKTSAAAKAEQSGLFASDGVGMPERGRPEVKPGVRFMVSSELEGDSLLDEVNKMSLETVGEGEGDKDDQGVKVDDGGRTPGSETPKTPPSLSASSSRGHPASPSGTTTPWSKPSVRSSSQHDTLRSVWEAPLPSTTTPVDGPSRATIGLQPQASASQPDLSTPMYPSLNAPSPSGPPAAQPLAPKMAFSASQSFSSPGTTASQPQLHSAFAMRQPQAGMYGYPNYPQQVTSPDSAAAGSNMMGLSYASLGQRSASTPGSTVNGTPATNGYQQAVWSPSAFGSGYGYSAGISKAVPTAAEQKVIQQTYGAQSKDGVFYPSPHQPAPSVQSPVYAQQQAYSSPNQYQQGYAAGRSGMYYGGAGGAAMYGSPGQQQHQAAGAVGAGRGRFSQANGGGQQANGYNGYTNAAGGDGMGGYYGGVAGQQRAFGYGATAGAHGAIGQGGVGRGSGGAGRKMW